MYSAVNVLQTVPLLVCVSSIPGIDYGECGLLYFSGNAEGFGTMRIGLLACTDEVRLGC